MRITSVGFGIALILAATTASAAGGVGGKGDTGGKGGTGPGGATGAEGASVPASAPDSDTQLLLLRKRNTDADAAAREAAAKRAWDVSITYSTNRTFIYTDEGSTHFGQTLFGSAGYALTDHDRVSVSAGLLQGSIIVDPGETGLRAADVTLAYSHGFDLPWKLKMPVGVSTTVPVSYGSQLASNVTSPGASVGLSRVFGDLLVSTGVSGRFYWDRYTTAAAIGDGSTGASSGVGSGAPNTKYSAGASIGASYTMPFHRPLSLSVTGTDTYRWLYNVGTPPLATTYYQATADPQFGTDQPILQAYGFDVHATYALPELAGTQTKVLLGADNGGASAVLHDGVVHTYFFFRDSSEVYVALVGVY